MEDNGGQTRLRAASFEFVKSGAICPLCSFGGNDKRIIGGKLKVLVKWPFNLHGAIRLSGQLRLG